MFNYYQPTHLYFGEGRIAELGSIARPYGTRCMLVTTNDNVMKKNTEAILSLLNHEGLVVTHFNKVLPNPNLDVIEAGVELAKTLDIEFIIAFGGGSSIDTAKAISFGSQKGNMTWEEVFEKYNSPFSFFESNDKALPIISIPTTSGTGSHVTHASVISVGDEKKTFFHQNLFSKEAIIDPVFMKTLPIRMSAATGFDAFTHAFESFINERASYYTKIDSLAAMNLVIQYLPKVIYDPSNLEYRKQLALADTLAGRALTNAGANAPHPISEIIGGITHIVHGEALAAIYPSFVHFSLEKHAKEFTKIAQLFDPTKDWHDLEMLLTQFITKIGLSEKLTGFQIDKEQFEKIITHDVFDHLPFGDREYFVNIILHANE